MKFERRPADGNPSFTAEQNAMMAAVEEQLLGYVERQYAVGGEPAAAAANAFCDMLLATMMARVAWLMPRSIPDEAVPQVYAKVVQLAIEMAPWKPARPASTETMQ